AESETAGRRLDLLHVQRVEGIAEIAHDGQAAQIGNDFAQEFEPLGSSIGRLTRQSGDVAAWSRQTGDDAGADRIPRGRNHNRDHRCCLLRREDCWGTLRDNDIDLELDELGCDLGGALLASPRPRIPHCNGATFDPPELTQPLHKSSEPFASSGMGVRTQEADGPQTSGLLRARRERPHRPRAAEKRNELAALHSITLSARSTSPAGTSWPIAFAVLRLMTSSNRVGCSTGRSAGLMPRSSFASCRLMMSRYS